MNITINFKDAIDARKLISRDSGYIRAMNQPNLVARGCSSQDELFNKYLDAFEDITSQEKDQVNKMIYKMVKLLLGKLVLIDNLSKFITKCV